MKTRSPCFHGCPPDTNFLKCWRYAKNGSLCAKPAVAVDPELGGYVCAEHRDEAVAKLKAEQASLATAIVGWTKEGI